MTHTAIGFIGEAYTRMYHRGDQDTGWALHAETVLRLGREMSAPPASGCYMARRACRYRLCSSQVGVT